MKSKIAILALALGAEADAIEQLALERGEEALTHCIVVRLSLSNDSERIYRIGARRNVAPAFGMSVEGDRREHADDDSPEHVLMVRGAMRW